MELYEIGALPGRPIDTDTALEYFKRKPFRLMEILSMANGHVLWVIHFQDESRARLFRFRQGDFPRDREAVEGNKYQFTDPSGFYIQVDAAPTG